jgi:hypothetical protein
MPFYDIPEPRRSQHKVTGEEYIERGYDAVLAPSVPGAHGANLKADITVILSNLELVSDIERNFLAYILKARCRPVPGKLLDTTPIISDRHVAAIEAIVELHKNYMQRVTK